MHSCVIQGSNLCVGARFAEDENVTQRRRITVGIKLITIETGSGAMMKAFTCRIITGVTGLLIMAISNAGADEVRVAVSANFTGAIARLAPEFEHATGHQLAPS